MLTHVVLDLETLGTAPDAAVVALGAVSFTADRPPDPAAWCGAENLGGWNLPAFYTTVEASRGKPDAGAFLFWLQQSDEARTALLMPGVPESGLPPLLGSWMAAQCEDPEEVRVWAHATFDPVILDQLYRRQGLRPPWSFRAVRDLRTVYELAEVDPHDPVWTPDAVGGRPFVEHHALHDAYREAVALRAALRKLNAL